MKNTFEFVKEEEGFRSKPYFDTLGIGTFGIGFTYITEDEANVILKYRLDEIEEALDYRYFWFGALAPNRKTVIISMVYQLGMAGFEQFKKMRIALEEEDYEEAAKQMLNSKWAIQTPQRAKRQANMMRENK